MRGPQASPPAPPKGALPQAARRLDTRREIWSFPATAGQRVTLMLDTNGPTRLQVAKPSGDWEQARSTRGLGLGLSFEPTETGTYEAAVFMDTSRPVSYTLSLEPGFGRLVAEVLKEMGLLQRTIGVAPVGCAVFAYNYFDTDFVEAPHGRAPAMATGIKRVLPDRIVFTYQGDGDLASIGMGEIVHAAARGEKAKGKEEVSTEAVAFAHIVPGVHW